jgi:hypothetical protein
VLVSIEQAHSSLQPVLACLVHTAVVVGQLVARTAPRCPPPCPGQHPGRCKLSENFD